MARHASGLDWSLKFMLGVVRRPATAVAVARAVSVHTYS